MRTWITIAILLSAALAGCAGEEGMTPTTDPVQGSDDGTNETATSTNTATSTDAPEANETAANTPPTAELSADVVNGTAPLNVTFTLDGSDPDGDVLIWDFTIETLQNGTGTGNVTKVASGDALPAAVPFNFTEVGEYVAVLSVSDGKVSVNASLEIKAEAPAGAPAVVDTYEGGFVSGNAYGCALVRTSYTESDPQRGVAWDNYQIDQATWGQEYTATVDAAVGGGIEVRINAAGNNALIVHSTGLDSGSGTFTGVIPEGTEWIFWRACGGTDVTVTWSTGV